MFDKIRSFLPQKFSYGRNGAVWVFPRKPGTNYYKLARVYYNSDGEFGQRTGWIVHLPYFARNGGITAINQSIHSVVARETFSIEQVLVKRLGRQLSNVEDHGRELWVFGNTIYEIAPTRSIKQ